MAAPKTIQAYIEHKSDWSAELTALHDILQKTEFEEAIKWGMPAYMINGKNVVALSAFKAYVGLWFHQGVFLKDEAEKLVNAQEEKTKAMRQWRFHSMDEIKENKDFILSYLEEAINNQKLGKEVKQQRNKKVVIIPDELANILKGNKTFKSSFDALTDSKKREYADYISEAKRAETKLKRLDKIAPMIQQGIGLHDKYKG